MKNLPPIFKVSNNISSNNTSYYKSSSVNKMPVIKQKEEEEQASIEDKINAIFRTRGYPFNIPVTFKNKKSSSIVMKPFLNSTYKSIC